MSSINTGSININYPLPGINQNSQGFRDNFTSIKGNLDIAAGELTELQNKALLKSALDGSTLNNDCGNTLISNALTSGFCNTTYNLGNNLFGSVTIDIKNGDVQYGTITGNTSLGFSNWPPIGSNYQLVLFISVASSALSSTITFPTNVDIQSMSTIENSVGRVLTFPAGVTTLGFILNTRDCGANVSIIPINRSRRSTQISTNVPSTLVGAVGDRVGTVAVDSNYIYVCAANYDGATEVWKRTLLSNAGNLAVSAEDVNYTPAGANTVQRSVESKLRDTVSVFDFMTATQIANVRSGSGTIDVTVPIQNALNSGAKLILFPSGGLYLINGGLTLSTPGVTLQCSGATIKLKNGATTPGMLNITTSDCVVDGGIWDGNRTGGNTPTDTYTSYAVNLVGDRNTVKNARVINFYGIGLKGLGNYLYYYNNTITGCGNYGIFIDGTAGISHKGNRAIDNFVDMTDSISYAIPSLGMPLQQQGQAILFTASTGQSQSDWEIADNNIIGPSTGTILDAAINIGVRGGSGIVSNNTTRYGAMGFSEGGANCIISGNRFLDLRGTVRYGIEPSGKFTATGNMVTDAYNGIDVSGASNYDSSTISGNTISIVSGGDSVGIRFVPTVAGSAKNITITGNNITTVARGITLTRDCTGATISGNTFVGPGSGVSNSRGLFLDTLPAAALVSVMNNVFRGFEIPWSVYSATIITYTDLYSANNVTIDTGSQRITWPAEGSAIVGTRATVLGAEYGTRDTIDVATNVYTLYSTSLNNPEGLLTAGIGSIFVSLNSGGGVYRKNTGSGNTGWVAM